MPVLTEDLKRQIGQHFVFGFHGYDAVQQNDNIAKLIRDYHLGNVIVMKRNVKGELVVDSVIFVVVSTDNRLDSFLYISA